MHEPSTARKVSKLADVPVLAVLTRSAPAALMVYWYTLKAPTMPPEKQPDANTPKRDTSLSRVSPMTRRIPSLPGAISERSSAVQVGAGRGVRSDVSASGVASGTASGTASDTASDAASEAMGAGSLEHADAVTHTKAAIIDR
jgi:hypothetical protein